MLFQLAAMMEMIAQLIPAMLQVENVSIPSALVMMEMLVLLMVAILTLDAQLLHSMFPLTATITVSALLTLAIKLLDVFTPQLIVMTI